MPQRHCDVPKIDGRGKAAEHEQPHTVLSSAKPRKDSKRDSVKETQVEGGIPTAGKVAGW